MFPRKLLSPDEEIVAEARPNWSVLVRPMSLFLLVIAACIAIALVWSSAPLAVGYVLAAIGAIAAIWLVGKLIEWRARLLVITTNRVVYQWGVVRKTGREIPLDRVQDVTYHQTIVERLARAGSLTIESAGSSGKEPFPDVRHPAEMQSLINQLITGDRTAWRDSAYHAAGGAEPSQRAAQPRAITPQQQIVPGPPPTPPFGVPAASPLADQLRELERLHEAGVITDDEFNSRRRELLGFH